MGSQRCSLRQPHRARSVRTWAFLCAVSAFPARAHEGGFVVVNTTLGPVRGVVRLDSYDFSGIPFASPPVGPLRWRAPTPAKPWSTVLDATHPSPGCMQSCSTPVPAYNCPKVVSEDCLYLNVYTPTGVNASSKLPVMVWFYGGNFLEGWSSAAVYNGSRLAVTGSVVVVTANYRVGVLGFGYSDAAGIEGNFGLQDQAAALKWTAANIAAFGGDPGMITAMGQSAGAQSVFAHAVIPSSAGLFHRLIAHSCPLSLITRNKTMGNRAMDVFAYELGCAVDDKACLWGANSTAVLSAQFAAMGNASSFDPYYLLGFEIWTPTAETTYLPLEPRLAWQQGKVHPGLTALFGNTVQDGVSYAYGALTSNYTPPAEVVAVGTILFGLDKVVPILEQYPFPPSEANDSRPTASQIVTDSIWRCILRNVSLVASGRRESTYVYHFDHPASFGTVLWGDDWYCYNQSCHGGDIPFLFQPDLSLIGVHYTAAELSLCTVMQQYWSSFARTGVPTSKNSTVPVWPAFGSTGSVAVLRAEGVEVQDGSVDARVCAMWDRIGYDFP